LTVGKAESNAAACFSAMPTLARSDCIR